MLEKNELSKVLTDHIDVKNLTYCLNEFIAREKYYDDKIHFLIDQAHTLREFIRKSVVQNRGLTLTLINDFDCLIKLFRSKNLATADHLIQAARQTSSPVQITGYVHPDNLLSVLEAFTSHEHLKLLENKIQLLGDLAARYDTLMVRLLKAIPESPKNSALSVEINAFLLQQYPSDPDKKLIPTGQGLKQVLGDLFIAPVQKLAKYKTQITDLMRHIERESDHYLPTQQLLDSATVQSKTANDLLAKKNYKRTSTQSSEKSPIPSIFIQNCLALTDYSREHVKQASEKKILTDIKFLAINAYFKLQAPDSEGLALLADLKTQLLKIIDPHSSHQKSPILLEYLTALQALCAGEVPDLTLIKVMLHKFHHQPDHCETDARPHAVHHLQLRQQRENAQKASELSFLQLLSSTVVYYRNDYQKSSFFKAPFDPSQAVLNRLKNRLQLLYQYKQNNDVHAEKALLQEKPLLHRLKASLISDIQYYIGRPLGSLSAKDNRPLIQLAQYLNSLGGHDSTLFRMPIANQPRLIPTSEIIAVLNQWQKTPKLLDAPNSPLKDEVFFVAVQKHLLENVKIQFSAYKKELESRTGIYGFFKNTHRSKVVAFEAIFEELVQALDSNQPLAPDLPQLINSIKAMFEKNMRTCGRLEQIYLKDDFGKAYKEVMGYLEGLQKSPAVLYQTQKKDKKMIHIFQR